MSGEMSFGEFQHSVPLSNGLERWYRGDDLSGEMSFGEFQDAGRFVGQREVGCV
jgi:hypothetical protein